MAGEQLTIVTVNYNTSAFLEVSLRALAALTKNIYKVIICDNGSGWLDRRRLRRIARRYENVELIFRRQSGPGSTGHGEALNLLIEKIDTPYGAMLDADATFLKKHWDDILIGKLGEGVKIIGAPPTKGNRLKANDFPLTYAVLFDATVFRSLKIDLRPRNPETGQDTGYEMEVKFRAGGYEGIAMEDRNTRVYKEGPFRKVICSEYYLPGHEGIFACHFGRGAGLGGAKYRGDLLLRLPVISRIARRITGYRQRGRWLKICREIIAGQSENRLP